MRGLQYRVGLRGACRVHWGWQWACGEGVARHCSHQDAVQSLLSIGWERGTGGGVMLEKVEA